MNNEDLLNALRRNPEVVLSQAFEDYRTYLKGIVTSRLDRRLRGRVDPSDVVQETLIEAYTRVNDYLANSEIPLKNWLGILASQQVMAAHRRHVQTQKRSVRKEVSVEHDEIQSDLHQAIASDATDPGVRVQRIERGSRLEQAISLLPPKTQQVVRMRFLEEMSLADIARQLGITVDAVSKRAMRGLNRLSEFVETIGLSDSSVDTPCP